MANPPRPQPWISDLHEPPRAPSPSIGSGFFDQPHEEKVMRAMWQGRVTAESDRTIVVEGNHYFLPGSLRREHLRESSRHSVCSWKGTASYFDVVIGEQLNADAS
ncbi:MAG TPA: DUF427 domain-containing protein [Rhodanobacter sp.]|nr:DUF427 domain-containing protein [Rhodanobacter sp.]